MRCFTLVLCVAFAGPALAGTTRLALVVGANAGRGELPPLRYAENDAGKVARLLKELGEVAESDVLLLQGEPPARLEAALQQLQRRVQKAHEDPDERVVLLFFFSGHSDGEGLELGDAVLPFPRLKALLAGTKADVRLVIVDACKSGSAMRAKGGTKAAPFALKLTDTLETSGEAFISSAAEDEAALESSEVMGSLFTHHLLSGLRGAADVSGDKRVTLNEAYRYAYDQTVTRSAMLPQGSQHPTYDYTLTGRGELVLTTLETPKGQLVFPDDLERAVVSDVARDQVLAEVPRGTKALAVPPGQYGVRLFKSAEAKGGRITVAEGASRQVRWDELTALPSSMLVARKGPGVVQALAPPRAWEDERVLSLGAGVARPLLEPLGLLFSARLAFEPKQGHGFSFALHVAYGSARFGWELGLEARAGLRAVLKVGPVWLSAGGEVGPTFVVQGLSATDTRGSFGLRASPRVAARVLLGESVALGVEADAGLGLYFTSQGVVAAFRPEGQAGVAVRF